MRQQYLNSVDDYKFYIIIRFNKHLDVCLSIVHLSVSSCDSSIGYKEMDETQSFVSAALNGEIGRKNTNLGVSVAVRTR